jgi:hypothetical protein
MDIQEKQDLQDLLGIQEVEGSQEGQELKDLLVTKEVKGSQVCQVRTCFCVMQFICLKN